MGKKITLIVILVATNLFAQEKSVVKAWLIKTTLTISPGKSLSTSNSYFYLHGLLEGYLSDKISVSGEGYFNRGHIKGTGNRINFNHSLFFGFNRHFVKNNLDFHIGIQPGLLLTEVILPYQNFQKESVAAINPAFSTLIGVNYFVGKYVHFFAQTRLVIAEHNSNIHMNLNELRFSAGLGFNLNTKK